MNEEEMRKRLNDGEDPLELSILKWQDIIYHDGADLGTRNCALCAVYYTEDCKGCPVKEHSGRPDCRDTPYSDWKSQNCRYTYNLLTKEIATRELEFLKSLRG